MYKNYIHGYAQAVGKGIELNSTRLSGSSTFDVCFRGRFTGLSNKRFLCNVTEGNRTLLLCIAEK